jgi:hypothetical protein
VSKLGGAPAKKALARRAEKSNAKVKSAHVPGDHLVPESDVLAITIVQGFGDYGSDGVYMTFVTRCCELRHCCGRNVGGEMC